MQRGNAEQLAVLRDTARRMEYSNALTAHAIFVRNPIGGQGYFWDPVRGGFISIAPTRMTEDAVYQEPQQENMLELCSSLMRHNTSNSSRKQPTWCASVNASTHIGSYEKLYHIMAVGSPSVPALMYQEESLGSRWRIGEGQRCHELLEGHLEIVEQSKADNAANKTFRSPCKTYKRMGTECDAHATKGRQLFPSHFKLVTIAGRKQRRDAALHHIVDV